jgi:hypothetical protein
VFERSGHFPHLDEPERFARTLHDWIATTEPGGADFEQFRRVIREASASR